MSYLENPAIRNTNMAAMQCMVLGVVMRLYSTSVVCRGLFVRNLKRPRTS